MISETFVAGSAAIELRKSTRLLREHMKNLVAMKLMDKSTLDEESLHLDGCEKCDHICIRSPTPKCVCADGYSRVGGKCQAASQRLLYTTVYNEMFWHAVDGQPNVSIPVALTGNLAAARHPRFIAVDGRRKKMYLIESNINELWSVELGAGKKVERVLRGEIPRLSGLAVDTVTGYVYVSSFQPSIQGKLRV